MAWRHGGENPYALFNGLTADLRPLENPTAPPRPSPYPGRVKLLIYGFARFANKVESGKEQRRRQQMTPQERKARRAGR